MFSLSIMVNPTDFFSKQNQTSLTKREYTQLFEPFGQVYGITYCLANDEEINANSSNSGQSYENEETREIVALVNDAAGLVRIKGEAAFNNFRVNGSRWRQGEMYIFVLDPEGNMLVHPDHALEGKNVLNLKDINGRPIIEGIIDVATKFPSKPEGWYHYEWPVPGGILPRWKSTYVRLVTTPSNKRYLVASGMYNDRMERAFVVDVVRDAVAQVEKNGEAAFSLFHDRTGPFIAKDAYIFVIDPSGVDLVNPGFPNLEGRNILEVKDKHGKKLIREMLQVVEKSGSGWVDYMWPKPGESVSTKKSAYVSKAKMGDKWVLIGCGVYLADAPKEIQSGEKISATELMAFVREGADVLEKQGDGAYREFRKKGSKWFHDDTYFFVWSIDGTRVFHATNPSIEGENASGDKDIVGRPYGKMFLDVASSQSGEGWVHYMYPKPGEIFPTWKSTFVKRVTFPSGKEYIIGSGIYNMKMDKTFIEDLVNSAAALVAERGKEAFSQLRDKEGPFVFMDTYVFVETPDGIELVNPAQPSLEGKNLIDLRDLKGRAVIKDEINAAMKDGSVWIQLYWYKPGNNMPAPKQTFVRKVQSGDETYIIGSGFYTE